MRYGVVLLGAVLIAVYLLLFAIGLDAQIRTARFTGKWGDLDSWSNKPLVEMEIVVSPPSIAPELKVYSRGQWSLPTVGESVLLYVPVGPEDDPFLLFELGGEYCISDIYASHKQGDLIVETQLCAEGGQPQALHIATYYGEGYTFRWGLLEKVVKYPGME